MRKCWEVHQALFGLSSRTPQDSEAVRDLFGAFVADHQQSEAGRFDRSRSTKFQSIRSLRNPEP